MADYSKLKTPFYEISVGDSSATTDKDFVPLPKALMKLVKKVEILETWKSNTCFLNTITITFIEGSREPFVNDPSVDASSLYGAAVTNASGMLTDLRFQSSGGLLGLTSLLPDKVGKAVNKVAGLVGLAQEVISFGESPKTYGNQKPPGPVKYLFQERNKVKVTWGYVERKDLTRTVIGDITYVRSDFPEKDMPTTTITCHDTSYAFDQLSIGVGKIFGNYIPLGFSEQGIPLFDLLGLKVGEIIEKVCTDIGVKCNISKSFLNESPAKGTGIVIYPTESVDQFFKRLASMTNSYYSVTQDTKTGQDIVHLIRKKEVDSLIINSDLELLRYKGRGSILKSVNIIADFGGITGNSTQQINKKGEIWSANGKDTEDIVMYEGGQLIDTDPTSHNPSKSAKAIQEKLAKTSIPVGTTEVAPASQDRASIQEASQTKAGCQSEQIAIQFYSLGYPNLIPGTHHFSGVGERYTGEYHIMTITHTIDDHGYSCRGTGTSNTIFGQSGVEPINANKPKRPATTKDVQLIEKLSSIDPSNIGKNFSNLGSGEETAAEKYKKALLS